MDSGVKTKNHHGKNSDIKHLLTFMMLHSITSTIKNLYASKEQNTYMTYKFNQNRKSYHFSYNVSLPLFRDREEATSKYKDIILLLHKSEVATKQYNR